MHLVDFSKRAPVKYQIKDHNGYGIANCIVSGDRVEAFIRIGNDQIIEDAELVVTGGQITRDICNATLELTKGKSIFEFYEIKPSQIEVTKLPDYDYDFVTYDVGIEAISSAIKNYFDRKG